MKARIIRVAIRDGDHGLIVATSPDLKGLYVVGRSRSALHDELPLAIEALFAAKGTPVGVHELEDAEPDVLPWVAVPLSSEQRKRA